MLRECRHSIAAQTFTNFEHLVLLDDQGEGCAKTMNKIANTAQGGWFFILADDDLALPTCLEQHLMHRVDHGIVYCPPLVWNEPPTQFWGEPPNIPASVLISRETWAKLGGYDEKLVEREDNEMFARAEKKGVPFIRFEYPTWVYRFHGRNKSRKHTWA